MPVEPAPHGGPAAGAPGCTAIIPARPGSRPRRRRLKAPRASAYAALDGALSMAPSATTLTVWLYAALCAAAVAAGAAALWAPKGSARHRRGGRWYVGTLPAAQLTALLLDDSGGGWRLFDGLAVLALLLVACGAFAAPRQARAPWSLTHFTCMLWSYYLLLVGTVNAAFLRLPLLEPVSPLHGQPPYAYYAVQQILVLACTAGWIVWLIRHAARAPDGAGQPDRAEAPDGAEQPDGVEQPDGTERPDGAGNPGAAVETEADAAGNEPGAPHPPNPVPAGELLLHGRPATDARLAAALDETIHAQVRLGIVVLLDGLDTASFTTLKHSLELTDGNLSTHLRRLEKAGYVELAKAFVDRKTQTNVRLTEQGRRAFREYAATVARVLRLPDAGGGEQIAR